MRDPAGRCCVRIKEMTSFVATARGTPMTTNVAVLARAIHGSQQTGGTLQIVLYVRGVGTTGWKLETWIEGANERIHKSVISRQLPFSPNGSTVRRSNSYMAFTRRPLN
jgi:hypothetical protein